jgi:hypothetical protein
MFKMIQLTNKKIGVVPVGAYIPLGAITRRIDCDDNTSAFTVSSSGADTITINTAGYYEITYSITEVATNDGLNTVTLVVNGVDALQVGETVATAGDTIDLTIPYVVRVFKRCDNVATNNPMTIQFRSDTAITSATSNVIVKKVY